MITLAVALVGGFVFKWIVDYVFPLRPGSSSTFDLVAREISANTKASPTNTPSPTPLNTFDFVLKCTNPNIPNETVKIFSKTGGESLFANFTGTDFNPSVSFISTFRQATDLTFEFYSPSTYLNGDYAVLPSASNISLDRRTLELNTGRGAFRASWPCERLSEVGDAGAEYEGLIAQARSANEAEKQKQENEKAAALRDRKL